MVKNRFVKGMYYWHMFQHRLHEQLLKDCICEKTKSKLKIKALYHRSKVIELFYRINEAI